MSSEFLEPTDIKKYVGEYQNGNTYAAHKLVQSFIPLINKVALEYVNSYTISISKNDLFQEAIIGFYKSLKSFDPNKGNLSVYCIPYIRRELMDYIFNNKELVRTITTKDMRKLYFNRNRYMVDGKIDIDEMAKSENVSRDKVIEFIDKLKFKPVSAFILNEDDEYVSTVDSVECEWSDIEYLVAIDDNEYKKERLKKALPSLSEREMNVIKCMYLNEDTITLSELARKQSVSPQRIKQIEMGAIKKLKSKV